ncbi:MAG: Txe/YoeB family addiction module toxin [Candidatus Ancillula sp.]|jgi:toxin YoeB|nr:Txe/YoeB family addiction module toxin [Candidatus Ancillula sp.]
MQITWSTKGWEHYTYWQNIDRKTIKKINKIVADIVRNGYEGMGKPEPLKGDYSGWWSRRIDSKNRIIYRVDDTSLFILSCKGHYDQ